MLPKEYKLFEKCFSWRIACKLCNANSENKIFKNYFRKGFIKSDAFSFTFEC